MVMVFTLVSSAQEWLHTKYEEEMRAKEEQEALRLKEQEEAERKRFDFDSLCLIVCVTSKYNYIRFEGTRVTIETFLKWRQQFEEEMGIDKKRELIDKEGRKLTGK